MATHLLVRTDSEAEMARAVILVLDRARTTQENFTFGPLDGPALEAGGLNVAGDVDGVYAVLREVLPNLQFEVDGEPV